MQERDGFIIVSIGNSLMVQSLRLYASTAESAGLIPGPGTKIPHATWHGQKKKAVLTVVVSTI